MTNAAGPRSLVPVINSDDEYTAAVQQVEPWLPAVYEVCRREDIRVVGLPRRGVGGLYPAVIVPPGHVIKLYGRWEAGRATYRSELEAYQLLASDPALPAPNYVGHGDLDDEWSYLVITLLPGVQLSSVRDQVASDDLVEVAEWLGRFVRRLHSVSLDAAAREDGWRAWVASTTTRYGRVTSVLTGRESIPPRLIDEVETWMPPLPDLLPSSAAGVLLHADLHDGHILGEMHGDRFVPSGVIDFNRAQVGHPFHELAAICRWVFVGERSLTRAFLAEARLPAVDDAAFRKRALAYILIHDADQLGGLPVVEQAANLDDLALRLFAPVQ